MVRQIIISSVAAVVLVSAGMSSDAFAKRGKAGHVTHRSHGRVYAARPVRARPASSWDDWGARWRSEVGNCPTNWSCYPLGND